MDKKNLHKEYSNGEVTVVWQSSKCIHSKNCFNGLPKVFNPEQRPWIQLESSNTEAIMAQVGKCPSGALSYYKNGEKEMEEEQMEEQRTKIEVMKNGPLLVHGAITVKGKDGNESAKDKVTALCRCGQSANKPYCDGTHNTCGFKDE